MKENTWWVWECSECGHSSVELPATGLFCQACGSACDVYRPKCLACNVRHDDLAQRPGSSCPKCSFAGKPTREAVPLAVAEAPASPVRSPGGAKKGKAKPHLLFSFILRMFLFLIVSAFCFYAWRMPKYLALYATYAIPVGLLGALVLMRLRLGRVVFRFCAAAYAVLLALMLILLLFDVSNLATFLQLGVLICIAAIFHCLIFSCCANFILHTSISKLRIVPFCSLFFVVSSILVARLDAVPSIVTTDSVIVATTIAMFIDFLLCGPLYSWASQYMLTRPRLAATLYWMAGLVLPVAGGYLTIAI